MYALIVFCIVLSAVVSYYRFIRKTNEFISDAYKFRFGREYDPNMQIPTRLAVNFLQDSSIEDVEIISARSKIMHRCLKTPLILLTLTSAAWTSLQVSSSKIMTEVLLAEEKVTWLTVIMLAFTFVFANMQLLFLNLALKFFN
jgi:hypothetical protein